MGENAAHVVTDIVIDVIGAKNGSEDVLSQVENLSEHKHDLRGDSGDSNIM